MQLLWEERGVLSFVYFFLLLLFLLTDVYGELILRYAFMHMGDWVLWSIEASTNENLAPARHLIKRLRSRDFYQAVYSPTHVPPEIKTEEEARVSMSKREHEDGHAKKG